MKILFVIYDYLPVGSAEANILSKLVNELLKYNNLQIDILTTKCNCKQNNIEFLERCKIYRIFFGRNISIRRSKLNLKIFITVFIEKLFDFFGNKLKKYNFLNTFLISKFFKALKINNMLNYDYIIPVCGFFEILDAVIKFKEKYNLKSKVLLYQLDPIANNDSYGEKSKINRTLFEKELSEKIDGIITTDYLIKQKRDLKFNIDKCFGFEFPNVFNNTKANNKIKTEKEKIKVVFCGTLNKEIRDPKFVLEIISKLELDIQFLIVGSGCNELIAEYEKTSFKIKYLGIKNLDEATKIIDEADFLVNIGNNNTKFVPSKIFDYISTGKPIINFYKKNDCPTVEYLKNYRNSISLLEDYSSFNDQLNKLYDFINNNKYVVIKYEEIKENYKKYSAEYMAEELNKLFINFKN